MPKKRISPEDAMAKFGIKATHERMDNGEMHFRLMGSDGNGYIRTVATSGSGWQNSHKHDRIQETYIVEKGWMGVATLRSNGGQDVKVYLPQQTYTTRIGEAHNIYLPD